MNRDRAKIIAPIIQAYADGEQIQSYSEYYGKWIDIDEPHFNDDTEYRVKPDLFTDLVKFLNGTAVFFDMDKKSTFRVTEEEWKVYNEKYKEAQKFFNKFNNKTIVLSATIPLLNGSSNWIYRESEDYSDLQEKICH